MSTMAKVGLPDRKFDVSLIEKGRAHFYQVTEKDGTKNIYGGVTGVLQIINKPALIPWATNQGIARTVSSLVSLLGADKEVEQNATYIAGAIKAAKKKTHFVEALSADLFGKFKLGKKTAKLDHGVLAEIIWGAIQAPEKIKREAGDLGTMAHQVFDRIVKGETVMVEEVDERVRKPVQAFIDWLKGSGIQMVMGDTRVASLQDKFGGSLDALGWKDDHYVLLDWKTSSGIWDEYALQVAAYAQAFEETFGVPVGEAHVIRFGKEKAEFEHKKVSNLTVSYGAFTHAKELQSLLKEFKHFDE